MRSKNVFGGVPVIAIEMAFVKEYDADVAVAAALVLTDHLEHHARAVLCPCRGLV